MSADNGIYVMPSPVEGSPDTFEYRVAYGQAIDNVSYYSEGTPESFAMENAYFGSSEVFNSADAALAFARDQEKQFEEGGGYLEYGVGLLKPRSFSFKTMSPEEYHSVLGWPFRG